MSALLQNLLRLILMVAFQAPWYSDGNDVGRKILRTELEIKEGEMEPVAEDFLRKVS